MNATAAVTVTTTTTTTHDKGSVEIEQYKRPQRWLDLEPQRSEFDVSEPTPCLCPGLWPVTKYLVENIVPNAGARQVLC